MTWSWGADRDDRQDPFYSPGAGTGPGFPQPGLPGQPHTTSDNIPPKLVQGGSLPGRAGFNSQTSNNFGSNTQSFSPNNFKFDDNGMQALLDSTLQGLVKNGETRWTPQVMDASLSSLKAGSEGQATGARDAIYQDSARRGMFRAGDTGTRVDTARRAASAQYGEGKKDLLIQKAKDDFEDKMAGLDRAQRNLDALRAFSLSSDSNSIQRDQLRSQIALGYAQLASQRENLLSSLGANWDIANLNRQPIEGRDFIWMDIGGQRVQIPTSLLPYLTGGGYRG